MVRTQVYLTPEEKEALEALARATGRSQSVLIREAVDRLVHSYSGNQQARRTTLDRVFGSWKGRSARDFARIRSELDRVR